MGIPGDGPGHVSSIREEVVVVAAKGAEETPPGLDRLSAFPFVFQISTCWRWEWSQRTSWAWTRQGSWVYPRGFYTRARRGRVAVQIRVACNKKQSCRVMVCRHNERQELHLFTLVQGETV
jgi:hypothetical protein